MVPEPQPTHRTMDNLISATLSAADKAAILTKINEIKALLPFLINLTVEEKSSLPKMSTFRDGMDAAFAAAVFVRIISTMRAPSSPIWKRI
jgi:hypothetical protein